MTQSAWTRDGRPVDAATISTSEWETLKQHAQLGDFVMPCCRAPAVLKTSINGLQFFAHLSDECATAPETVWHKSGYSQTGEILGIRCGVLLAYSTRTIYHPGQGDITSASKARIQQRIPTRRNWHR